MQRFDKQEEGQRNEEEVTHNIEFGQLKEDSFPFSYYVICGCGYLHYCYDLEECEYFKKEHLTYAGLAE